MNNHLARVPIIPYLEGTVDMSDEMLSSAVAQEMDAKKKRVSALVDVEFYWQNYQPDVDALIKPGIDTPFWPSTFNDYKKGSRAKNPFLRDKPQDKMNSAIPHPTNPISKRPNQSILLLSRLFGTRIENVQDYVDGNLFEKFFCLLLCMSFNMKEI